MAENDQAGCNDAQIKHEIENEAKSKECDEHEDGASASTASFSGPNNGVQESLDGDQVHTASLDGDQTRKANFVSFKPEAFKTEAMKNEPNIDMAGGHDGVEVRNGNQANRPGSCCVFPRSSGPPVYWNRALAQDSEAFGHGNAQIHGRGVRAHGNRDQPMPTPQRQRVTRAFVMHQRVTEEQLDAKIEQMRHLYGEEHHLVIKYESHLIRLRNSPNLYTYLTYDMYVPHSMEPM